MNTRIALAAFALASGAASASIINVSGSTTWLNTPPAACGPGQLTGFTAYAWDEQQNVALTLSVDMVNNPGSSAAPIAGFANGTFASHFLHFEPLPGAVGAAGTVTFNAPIVAVIFTPLNLDNSDAPAGAFGTLYPTLFPTRGLGTSNPPSVVTANGNVLTFNLHVQIPSADIIQVRVLTQVPAPGVATAFLLGLATCSRRQRNPAR